MKKELAMTQGEAYTGNGVIERGYEILDEWSHPQFTSQVIVRFVEHAVSVMQTRGTRRACMEALACLFALDLHIKETYGVTTYLLSNISHYFADHAHEVPILELIDHPVYSSRCGFVKPHEDIYRYLCDTYGLEPSDVLFVDDRADNVEAAEKIGIHGYVFDGDTARLRTHLDEILK